MRKDVTYVLIGIGSAAFAYCLYQVDKFSTARKNLEKAEAKMEKAEERLNQFAIKLGKSMDDILDSTNVEEDEEVVKKAVDEAAKREADKQVQSHMNSAARNAVALYNTDISTKVRKAVDDASYNLKRDVRDEINRQVKLIDIDSIRREIVSKAKDEAYDKFREKLDEFLDDAEDKFTDKLDDKLDDLDEKFDDKIGDILDDLEEKDLRRLALDLMSMRRRNK